MSTQKWCLQKKLTAELKKSLKGKHVVYGKSTLKRINLKRV